MRCDSPLCQTGRWSLGVGRARPYSKFQTLWLVGHGHPPKSRPAYNAAVRACTQHGFSLTGSHVSCGPSVCHAGVVSLSPDTIASAKAWSAPWYMIASPCSRTSCRTPSRGRLCVCVSCTRRRAACLRLTVCGSSERRNKRLFVAARSLSLGPDTHKRTR